MLALGVAAELLLAVQFAGRIQPADLWAVPATLVVATLLEYVAHRYVMHVQWRALGAIWDAHTGRHHHYYLEEAPTWERPADVWLILFSLRDVVTLVAIVAGPFAILRAAVPAGSWALAVATSIGFFLGYEALHMAYHLPDGHPALRRRWLAAMRAHHVRHHRLASMHANYGVTTRLWDRLFGTAAAPASARGRAAPR